MRVKKDFFCDKQVIVTNWPKKRIRKFTFLKYSFIFFYLFFFFFNVLLLSILRNSLQTPSLDDILLGKFTLSNSAILVEDLIRWKRGFEIFLIKHGAGDIKNKNIAGKYSKTPVSVSTTLY